MTRNPVAKLWRRFRTVELRDDLEVTGTQRLGHVDAVTGHETACPRKSELTSREVNEPAPALTGTERTTIGPVPGVQTVVSPLSILLSAGSGADGSTDFDKTCVASPPGFDVETVAVDRRELYGDITAAGSAKPAVAAASVRRVQLGWVALGGIAVILASLAYRSAHASGVRKSRPGLRAPVATAERAPPAYALPTPEPVPSPAPLPQVVANPAQAARALAAGEYVAALPMYRGLARAARPTDRNVYEVIVKFLEQQVDGRQ